jgi:hypothetical protein
MKKRELLKISMQINQKIALGNCENLEKPKLTKKKFQVLPKTFPSHFFLFRSSLKPFLFDFLNASNEDGKLTEEISNANVS